MKRIKSILKLTGGAVNKFITDSAFLKSAALSYYTIFSLPPMLFVVLWVSARIYDRSIVRSYLYDEIGSFIGQNAAEQIQTTVRQLVLVEPSIFTAIVGIGGILFTSTTVFVTMQNALNQMFHVQQVATTGKAVLLMIKDRILSLALLLVFAFILLISFAVDAFLSAFLANLEAAIGQFSTLLTLVTSIIFPLLVTGILFTLIFKFLPDVRLKWKHCLTGGMLTAILFEAGKALIGFYIGQSSLGDWYDAAGSLMILMVWVYYASVIFFFGAEITYLIAKESEGRVEAKMFARKTGPEELK